MKSFIVCTLLTIVQIIYPKRLISQPKQYRFTEGGNTIQVDQFSFDFQLQQNNSITNLEEDQTIIYQDFSKNYIKTHFQQSFTSNNIMKVQVNLKNLDQPRDIIDFQQEEFQIDIDENGQTTFYCHGYVSFLRALQTLLNLFDDKGIIDELPISIKDSPSYKYRGLMIDTSRHFLPIQYIKKTIRGMFITKFSVLHWHIVDHESFPIILENVPELSKFGAYSEEETYSKEQIQDIIQYAHPGHTQSWMQSPEYKDLNACPNILLTGQLDPTMNKTYDLVEKVFQEVQNIFSSNYFHVGGDEVIGLCYDFRPSIRKFMNDHSIKTYIELQHYYDDIINQYIDQEKQRIFWFDGDTKKLKYPKNSIIQFWGLSFQYHLLENYTEPVILSPEDHLYFDQGTGGWNGRFFGFYSPWHKVYEFKPKESKLGDRILGSEATLWSEVQNPQSLDYKAWPRSSALGLRLWNEDENLSLYHLVQELVDTNKKLMQTGISPGAVSKQYCEINIEKCFKGRIIYDVFDLLENQ